MEEELEREREREIILNVQRDTKNWERRFRER